MMAGYLFGLWMAKMNQPELFNDLISFLRFCGCSKLINGVLHTSALYSLDFGILRRNITIP